jgi:hypothetical protein
MAQTFYTQEEIERIRNSAKRLCMIADPRYYNSELSDLVQVCNGYGPDMWSDSLRGTATWLYRNFPEAASIHDWDFKFSDGKPETLRVVNMRFRENNKTKLNSIYPLSKPWLWPLRAVAWCKVETAFRALEIGSETAWKSAYERYGKEDCRYCVSRTPSTNMCHLRHKDASAIGWCRSFTAIDVSSQS